jgi:hypothetical protein
MQCCPEILACAASASCKGFTDCIRAHCANAPDLATCAVQSCSSYLGGIQLALAIQMCQQQKCAMACQ